MVEAKRTGALGTIRNFGPVRVARIAALRSVSKGEKILEQANLSNPDNLITFFLPGLLGLALVGTGEALSFLTLATKKELDAAFQGNFPSGSE